MDDQHDALILTTGAEVVHPKRVDCAAQPVDEKAAADPLAIKSDPQAAESRAARELRAALKADVQGHAASVAASIGVHAA